LTTLLGKQVGVGVSPALDEELILHFFSILIKPLNELKSE
jgi:hypothetical protein